MTSPPLSDPEAEIARVVEVLMHESPQPSDDYATFMLSNLWLAAKRSAHLEDARAGCVDCRRGATLYHKAEWGEGWFHGDYPDPKSPGDFLDMRSCERPEVWDALSLLPPKGTK